MSDDDRWSEVIHQVLDALDDGGVSDVATRDALAEGVRQVLESLEAGVDLDVQVLGEGFPVQESVGVEVVDGGRDVDQPRTQGEAPELRIADTEEVEIPSPRGSGQTPRAETGEMFTHVKVIRPDSGSTPRKSRPLPGLSEAGWIQITADNGPEAAWQTLYRGLSPRLYRVACSTGTLDVTVDGEPVERLRPGQSIDVEGNAIRVTTEDGESLGGYVQVGSTTGGEE